MSTDKAKGNKVMFTLNRVVKRSVTESVPDRACVHVRTHLLTLTQVGTGVYLGQTHPGIPFQVPAWVRKFSLGSTGDQIFSLMVSNIFEIMFFFRFLLSICLRSAVK